MRDFNEKERESYNKIVEDFSENVVILSEKEYIQLMKDSKLLEILYGHHVDNWEGWDFAMEEFSNIPDDEYLEIKDS